VGWFQWDLFENSVDSLNHGLEHYERYREYEYPSDAKQCVINLFVSIDTMLLFIVQKEIGEDFIYRKNKKGEITKNTISSLEAIDLIEKHIGEHKDSPYAKKVLRENETTPQSLCPSFRT
jgi:hypothetical protein